MKKRMLALFLAFVLALGLLPAPALAADAALNWLPQGLEPVIYIEETDRILARKVDMYYLLDRGGNVIKRLGRIFGIAGIDDGYAPFISEFSDGMASFTADYVHYGYLNANCEVVITTQYDYYGDFSEGLAPVGKDGLSGYIDKTGKMVVSPVYSYAGSFSEGLAAVGVGSYDEGVRYGFIDKTGKLVIPMQFDAVMDFSEGLAAVVKNGRTFYIDKTGNKALSLEYDNSEYALGSFSEGLAEVFYFKEEGYVTRTCYVDKTGKTVIPWFDAGSEEIFLEGGEEGRFCWGGFSHGLAGYWMDGRFTYIDKTGRAVFKLEENAVYPTFSHGLAYYSVMDDRFETGYAARVVDKTGKRLLPQDYEGMVLFSGCGWVYDDVRYGGTGRFGVFQNPYYEGGPAFAFDDLKPNAYYLVGVDFAVENGITAGTTATTFSPDQKCTHGQILTFLWRAAGKPASGVQLPFTVKPGAYYEGAARWAYERNMIGADFNADADCTRADAVRYLWQSAGSPAAAYDGRFTDIPAASPHAQAVAWAVAQGVTTGATSTTFNPSGVCSRGQIVTFMYRLWRSFMG